MRNWSVNVSELQKSTVAYQLWTLEQMINFGLCGRKLNRILLEKHLANLNVDPDRLAYLRFLLNAS